VQLPRSYMIYCYSLADISIWSSHQKPGKLREFRSLLAETGWRVLGLHRSRAAGDPEETGTGFAENAGRRRRMLSRDFPAVLADDSGSRCSRSAGGRGSAPPDTREAPPTLTDCPVLEELERAGGDRHARFRLRPGSGPPGASCSRRRESAAARSYASRAGQGLRVRPISTFPNCRGRMRSSTNGRKPGQPPARAVKHCWRFWQAALDLG